MKSIKTRLIVIFTIIIIIVTGMLSFVSIEVVRQNLINSAHSDLEEIAKEEAKYIQAKKDSELKYVDALAQNEIITNEDISFEQKVEFFENEAKRTGYLAFAFADNNGNSTVFNTKKETTNISARDYFQNAMNGELAASDVIISSVTGEPVVIFAAPVYKDGQEIGILYGRKDGSVLSDLVSEIKFRETGFTYMVNNEGTSVGDRNKDLVVNQVNFLEAAKTDTSLKDLADLMTNKMLKREVGSGKYAYEGKDQIVAFAPIEGSPWIMAVGIETSEILSELNSLTLLLIILCLVAVIVGLIIIYFFSDRIAKPIKKITEAAQQISKGNFDIHLSVKSNDEIGKLAQAFDSTINQLVNYQEYIDEISDALLNISKGNLMIELQKKYVGQFEKLKNNMEALVENLNSTLTQINQSAYQVSSGSEMMACAAQALSQGATEQASSVEELSASISEITKQVIQNAKNSKLANNSAEIAGKEIHNSNELMKNMVTSMEQISLKSSEISNIIKVIDNIAFQTNILALNAAVEAARAGTAGKGFAVVADEVRNLAGKSAQAAKDTTTLIGETLEAIQNSSKIVNETAISLETSSNVTSEAVILIDKIAIATNEQATSIEQVSKGIEQISEVVQTNAATAEESAATCEELSNQSILLKELISSFKLKNTVDNL
jgi:methyl-accepting chemotaxis protein